MIALPPGAVPLLSPGSLSGWRARRGGPANWQWVEGALQVGSGAGDLFTEARFTDFQLHLEFWLPHLPHARGQQRANSGLYLQGRFELQLLDSHGVDHPRDDDCGALYKQAAPMRNACLPPEHWQFLDVAFRAPRVGASGCLTVFHNGVLIHHHVPLTHPTPGGLELAPFEPGPILLQDHGDPVRFRNLWVLPTQTDGTIAAP